LKLSVELGVSLKLALPLPMQLGVEFIRSLLKWRKPHDLTPLPALPPHHSRRDKQGMDMRGVKAQS
jgi:hypothetical protein